MAMITFASSCINSTPCREVASWSFRGGTALRWCYGGSRFSEDLDFVTPLGSDEVRAKLNRALKAVEREMVPHFRPHGILISSRTLHPRCG
ncbi:MAG: nucleotidyl transferase AbiEii/AbiGii toxin family protein, partial [Thermodesulfobacteriota bacterium]